MDRSSQHWRELPRDGECVLAFLFGERAGACHGPINRHHVDPPDERTVQVCHRHHPKLETALRHLNDRPQWKRCPHRPGTHRYPGAKEACERQINRRPIRELVTAA